MKEKRRVLIQILLVLVTILTTTLAGVEWIWGHFLGEITWADFQDGLHYSLPFLFVLTCHEFGHYFTARYHNIKVSLPYYIPLWLGWLGPPAFSLGTMGAFIRIREHIVSRLHYFDVGISGPLAGFVVAIALVFYGFTHLPETEYIYEVHPYYEVFGENFEEQIANADTVIYKADLNPERRAYPDLSDEIVLSPNQVSFHFGDNLLFYLCREYMAPTDRYVPGPNEIMHYPYLLAGFLALFFTALNLLPIGQLDGGHITFGLFGAKWHQRISSVLFTIFIFYAGLGTINLRAFTTDEFLWHAVLWYPFLSLCAIYQFVFSNP